MKQNVPCIIIRCWSMSSESSMRGLISGSSLYGVYWNSPLFLLGGVGGRTIWGEGARGRMSGLDDGKDDSWRTDGSKLRVKLWSFLKPVKANKSHLSTLMPSELPPNMPLIRSYCPLSRETASDLSSWSSKSEMPIRSCWRFCVIWDGWRILDWEVLLSEAERWWSRSSESVCVEREVSFASDFVLEDIASSPDLPRKTGRRVKRKTDIELWQPSV